jgi:hypothetical protein
LFPRLGIGRVKSSHLLGAQSAILGRAASPQLSAKSPYI